MVTPPPRYDIAYWIGTAWLDTIARGEDMMVERCVSCWLALTEAQQSCPSCRDVVCLDPLCMRAHTEVNHPSDAAREWPIHRPENEDDDDA